MSNAVATRRPRTRHAHHPALQHHFDTMAQQKEAAVLGMWVFLLTEILFFGGLFVAYMIYRVWYFDAFAEASRSLEPVLGRPQHRGADRQLADDGDGGARRADQQAQGDGQLADPHDDPRRRVPWRQGHRVRRQVRAPSRAGPEFRVGVRARASTVAAAAGAPAGGVVAASIAR